MSELRKEVQDCIDRLPDSKLEALRPLLRLLTDDEIAVETDLTDEEKEKMLAESKSATSWVLELIKIICKDEEK